MLLRMTFLVSTIAASAMAFVLRASAAAMGDGEIIPLRDRAILVGEITRHDEEGLDVKRLDTGGLVHLRWTQLAPPYERSLKTKYGYTYEQADVIEVDADEITLRDGTKRVGIIDPKESNAEKIVLKDARSALAYPRSMLTGPPARVKAPALDIYSRDVLRLMEEAKTDLTTAQGNVKLARFLEQINDFTGAILRWNEARKIDPNYLPQEFARSVKQLEEKKLRQEELDFLQNIESARRSRFYSKAIAMCAEFPTRFPKSSAATRQDVEKRKKSAEDALHIEKIDKVWMEYHRMLRVVARRKASDRKSSLDAAQSYARGADMRKDILDGVVTSLKVRYKDMTEQEVTGLWKERGKRAKLFRATYGNGTFTLGKEGAGRGLGPIGSKGASSQNPEQQAMLKKLAQLLQKQQAGTGVPGEEKKMEPNDYWWYIGSSGFEKEDFLIATYAENSGEMIDITFASRSCNHCGGEGGLMVASTGGSTAGVQSGGGGRGGAAQDNQGGPQTTKVTCPTCQGVGIVRIVNYR